MCTAIVPVSSGFECERIVVNQGVVDARAHQCSNGAIGRGFP